jgi:CheY-like chemotaxis protein
MTDSPIVWVVDDDTDDQYLIETAFKRVMPSMAIKQLSDGDELLPCLTKAPALPRLILLDLNMRRMNGFEALKAVRNVPAFRKIPVVVLTTSTRADDEQKSMALGADGFFSKPPSQLGIQSMLQQLTADWDLK